MKYVVRVSYRRIGGGEESHVLEKKGIKYAYLCFKRRKLELKRTSKELKIFGCERTRYIWDAEVFTSRVKADRAFRIEEKWMEENSVEDEWMIELLEIEDEVIGWGVGNEDVKVG